MKYEAKSINATPEILKRRLGGELLVPITVTGFTNGVCKAGTPLNASGAVANTSSAVGILLNDVYSENPNGSLIKAFATINKTVAQTHSGVTLSSDAIAALDKISFE